MCYGVYISTDSGEDLSLRNSELVRFARVDGPDVNPCVGVLEFANKWYVGSESECSCTFRHLESIELGFGEPEDWCKEEKAEIDATAELYRTLVLLLSAGHKVDIMDAWEGDQSRTQPEDVRVLHVSLDEVSEKAFRLLIGHRFLLTKART
jgi:hypothetical protein